MSRPRVDPERCEANARCVAVAPEVFALGPQDEVSRVLVGDVPPALRPSVERAIRLCPRQAIDWDEPA